MYRPTVRYGEAFHTYIDAVFHTTHLDRNQILRGALFVAAHSTEFGKLLSDYQKKDVPLPSPNWSLSDNGLWMERCQTIEKRGEEIDEKQVADRQRRASDLFGLSDSTDAREARVGTERRIGTDTRREGAVSSIRVANTGGITFKID